MLPFYFEFLRTSTENWISGSTELHTGTPLHTVSFGGHLVTMTVSGDTESGYDYIYILDTDGNELAKLDDQP